MSFLVFYSIEHLIYSQEKVAKSVQNIINQ